MRIFYLFIFFLSSCNYNKYIVSYNGYPKAPDYRLERNWVSSPKKPIPLPKNYIDNSKSYSSNLDVFYIYPTMYYDGYNGNLWNADTEDEKLNEKIRKLPVNLQASIFSGIADVYSPLYRQLFYDALGFHISNEYLSDLILDKSRVDDYLYSKDKIYEDENLKLFNFENDKLRYFAKEANDVAYNDIRRAFIEYFNEKNNGKKFIIASHSQGSYHAVRLLNELIFKRKDMREKLLLSYLPGMPIEDVFDEIDECKNPDEVDCFLSWNTFGKGYIPFFYNDKVTASNPISFINDSRISDLQSHKGILLPNFFQLMKYKLFRSRINTIKLKREGSLQVQSENGTLQVKNIDMPFPINKLYDWKDYHIGDYNLFWLNIRENLKLRLEKNLD
mgnify:FL=1